MNDVLSDIFLTVLEKQMYYEINWKYFYHN